MKNSVYFNKLHIDQYETFYTFFKKSLAEQYPHYSKQSIGHILNTVYTKDSIRDWFKVGEFIIYCSYFNKDVIGYIIATKPYGGVSSAEWLAVSPPYQKQGIASKLIRYWEEFVLEHGGHKLLIWTTAPNTDFYHRRGFSSIGNLPDGQFGVDFNLMCKALRNSDERMSLK